MRQLIESKTFTEADSRLFGNSASLSKIPGFVFKPGKVKKTFNTSHKCKFLVSGSLYIHYVTYNTYWSDVFCFPYRGIEKELNLCLNRLFTSYQTHRRHIYQIWKPASHTWNHQLSRNQNSRKAADVYFYVSFHPVICDGLPAPLEEPTCPDALIGSLPSPFCCLAFIKCAFFSFGRHWSDTLQKKLLLACEEER